jgi:hypothetical protein
VAVVSESLARFLARGGDPLGMVVGEFALTDKAPRVTIVGVVGDIVAARLADIRPQIYRPLTGAVGARLVVRTDDPAARMIPVLRGVLQTIDPRVRADLAAVGDGLQRELDLPRTLAWLSGALAVLALTLAVIGIYGVTSFVTSQRTREIGVRLAMGASPASVLRLLLNDSLRPIAAGLLCGMGLTLLAGRAFRGVMYGLTAHDPLSLAAAVAILLTAAATAVYLPIRRASRLDPATVLRL